MSFFREFWEFFKVRKKYWLLPILIVLVLFGGLIILSQGSAIAPFIYAIFQVKVPILIPNIFNYPFTYYTDLNLKIGDYVIIPFGKLELTGVVWDEFEKKTNKNFSIKKVLRKLNVPSLKKNTIKFLNWFSEYNMIPKGMALRLLLLSGKAIE